MTSTKQFRVGGAVVRFLKGDITQQDTDVVVNAANSSLMGGGGVDGAIHRAGGPAILEACKRIVARSGRCQTGQAVITTAGKMAARHVIHTVGPVFRGGTRGESELLAGAYRSSLRLAAENGADSVSFPSISTGAYGYPVAEAADIAIREVIRFLEQSGGIEEVRFVLFTEGDLGVYTDTAARLHGERTG